MLFKVYRFNLYTESANINNVYKTWQESFYARINTTYQNSIFFFISYEVDQIYMTNCTRLNPYSFTLLTGLLYAICLSLKTLFHVMILVWIYIFRNLADIKEERDRRSDAIFLNNNKNEVKNCPYEWPNPEIIMNSISFWFYHHRNMKNYIMHNVLCIEYNKSTIK